MGSLKMTAIILAGGKASRMGGQDKAFLKIDNEPLISMQLRLLKKLFKEIIIVTNLSKEYGAIKDVKVISDIIPHQGPLGGIYSGLIASNSFYNFAVACDMPYIDTGLIEYMYKKSSGYDAVVPRLNKRYEPLYSFYSKNCLKFIGQLLDKKIFKTNKLFSRIKVKEITKEEVRQFKFGEKVFTNINTGEDLANAYADRPL
jgi:molybdopterin-guanine dinucleotide biosynthesis protein A